MCNCAHLNGLRLGSLFNKRDIRFFASGSLTMSSRLVLLPNVHWERANSPSSSTFCWPAKQHCDHRNARGGQEESKCTISVEELFVGAEMVKNSPERPHVERTISKHEVVVDLLLWLVWRFHAWLSLVGHAHELGRAERRAELCSCRLVKAHSSVLSRKQNQKIP